jgi:hypothetical protein
MKLENAIKKLATAGFTVKQGSGNIYFATKGEHTISFDAECQAVYHQDEPTDSISGYYPAAKCKSLADAMKRAA